MIALAVTALLACLAAFVWLLGTTSGTRKLLDTISGYTGLTISATRIEGHLAGTLRLENVDIKLPQMHIRIQHLELTAQTLELFAGTLSIQNLSMRNVSILDSSPDQPPILEWPRTSGVIKSLKAGVERLEIHDLTYRHLEKEPLQIQTILASVVWKNSHLSVNHLKLLSDQGALQGNLAAGFGLPLLEMDLAATPSHPVADMEIFRLRGKFAPGKSPQKLAGNLYLSGHHKLADKQPLWEMSVDTGMTSEGFPLKNIRLNRQGGRGLITGDGMLTVSGPEPFLSLQADTTDFDLASIYTMPGKITASLTFAGTRKQYGGHIRLINRGKGPQSLSLSGDYSGSAERVTLREIHGSALDGNLSGQLNIDWQNSLTIKGELSGRNLNPARIDPDWIGVINFDLSGHVSIEKQNKISGKVACTLRQSRLHGQQLTGDLRVTFMDGNAQIQHLALKGKGFHLAAAGVLNNKLDFTAQITDLSRLVPGTTGRITANGWMRLRSGQLSGEVSAASGGLTAGGLSIARTNLTAAIGDQETMPLRINGTFKTIRYHHFRADTLTLKGEGTQKKHSLEAALRHGPHDMHLTITGSYQSSRWEGAISRWDGTDGVGPWKMVSPAGLTVTSSGISLDPVVISGRNSENIKISCRLSTTPLTGDIALTWNALNLSRADAWTKPDLISGSTTGTMHLELLPREHINLSGKASYQGTINLQDQPFTIRQSELTLDATERGTRAKLDISLAQGGTITGDFSSPAPARAAFPDEGHFNLVWQGFDLAPLAAIVPGATSMEGRLTGRASGKLLPGQRLVASGQTSLTQSSIHWQGQKGDVRVDLRQASLDWVWQDEALNGDITLILKEYGKLKGRLRLPIAAQLPASMDPEGKIEASLQGQVREKGALSTLFPGLIQESRGDLDVDLKLSGNRAEPLIEGSLQFSKAGGYLPTAGITLKDARLDVYFEKDAIRLDSFRAASGQGHIEGSALIRMKKYKVTSFEGRLDGERFQTIYFPELRVQSSPKLTFTGTPRKLSIRGEVMLPDVSIIGAQSQGPVEASPDVIREGKTAPPVRKLPIDLDVEVKIVLGDQVLFKAAGIDAQLGGNIHLQFRELDKINGRGAIRVVKGRYRTYGVNLEIVRGQLFYAGGPINKPALDILALRTIGEVKAGVAVSGTLPTPLVKLYSEPPMQDMDILAYIVLGHPLGSSAQQASLLTMAASALLTSRQSEDLLGQIKNRLGVSTLEISSGTATSNGRMGYKPIKVAPVGTQAANSAESVSQTMLVVGKYLTPNLYVSYGRSIFTGGNLFFLRYNLSKNWQVESQTGQESGVDIYYKIEFN